MADRRIRPGVLCGGSGTRLWPFSQCTLLGLGLVHGVARYRWSVGWQPSWPRLTDEVRAWEADPRRSLAIWPPPWTMRLRPLDEVGAPK